MNFICGPNNFQWDLYPQHQKIVLFSTGTRPQDIHAGAAVIKTVKRHGMAVSPAAWDLLAIALSAYAADTTVLRASAPDGWTRQIQLTVAVQFPEMWNSLAKELADCLGFLSTDIWEFNFVAGGTTAPVPRKPQDYPMDAAVLLSGGLDSLVGALDLAANGQSTIAVSKLVRGDRSRQERYARRICNDHIVLNDSTHNPERTEPSQRTRSIVFIAFGTLVATALNRYRQGQRSTLYLCENGFIAINPSLTGLRRGSLSTRTAHPRFLGSLARLLESVRINVDIVNPYKHLTKGEMLAKCADQASLVQLATDSTSCGRYHKYQYTHCGRCVPCQVRRASILAWGGAVDDTKYVYSNLSIMNDEHAGFDDVRAVAMAVQAAKVDFGRWVGNALGSPSVPDRAALTDMLERGIDELSRLHAHLGVR
ncbi:TPA: Qat anti-phage system QueC-like protein QatC [Stenotrophomonas maltophilia]